MEERVAAISLPEIRESRRDRLLLCRKRRLQGLGMLSARAMQSRVRDAVYGAGA